MPITDPNLQVTRSEVHEHETHRFSADMSDIGLTVKVLVEQYSGRYPTTLTTDLGNGKPFMFDRLERLDNEDRDLVAIHYKQLYGNITLKLWND